MAKHNQNIIDQQCQQNKNKTNSKQQRKTNTKHRIKQYEIIMFNDTKQTKQTTNIQKGTKSARKQK